MAASTSSLASKVGSGLGFQRSELRGLPPPSVQISIQRHSRPSRRLGKNSFWFLCFGLLFDLYLKLSVFFCFSLHEAKTKKLAILWLSYDLFASFYLCWIWLRKIGFLFCLSDILWSCYIYLNWRLEFWKYCDVSMIMSRGQSYW